MVLASRIGLAGYGAKETLMEGARYTRALASKLLGEFKSEVRTGNSVQAVPAGSGFERAGPPTRFGPDACWVR